MNVDIQRVRRCLKDFDFKRLFIEELNWSICSNNPIDLNIKGSAYRCTPFAEMGGMVVFTATSQDGTVPPYDVRKSIEREIRKQVHEHILIFIDDGKSRSVWQWVKHDQGKPAAFRDHEFTCSQPGDSLLQKLNGIAFNISELDENGSVSVIKVAQRVAASFDVEKVTKRFYEEFKKEHDAFCKLLKGMHDQDEVDWYASVMLNRLMFIYFIQKKGFLAGDTNYLSNRLKSTKAVGANKYYRQLLIPLFFEGFAKEEKERLPEVKQLLGAVPYLNGGIFMPHKLESQYGAQINIADSAFERLFAFFDRYNWHLDYRPLRSDDEINPDVLGYIFEKYINQKQMGAYYTKEDITDYICKNTIIPFLFDKLDSLRYEDLHPFPLIDVEPYIYEAVMQEEYLPTETEREYKARKERYQQIKEDFTAGKIAGINDFITYNLDIRRFAEDWLGSISNPVTLRAFYFECLTKITVLDPTVGSGAFLFAALNILEPLYEICVDKLKELGGPKYPDFAGELKHIAEHPNRKYFIFKSIIINNLFGVDIMEEAVEICKLRLFLKLVAQVDDVRKIEPLPDIDFNIKAGNTLIGYTNLEEIRKVKATQLDLSGVMKDMEVRIQAADRELNSFRNMQTQLAVSAIDLYVAKTEVRKKLLDIANELNKDLAALYGATNIVKYVSSHNPFHWLMEFYRIMKNGGFDVIVGNPPYVAYSKVSSMYRLQSQLYKTESCANLYAFVMERSYRLLQKDGRLGMIVPVSLVSGESYMPLSTLTFQTLCWVSTYSNRPGKLFQGVEQRLTVLLWTLFKGSIYSTYYQHWYEEERPLLFDQLFYSTTKLDKIRNMPYKSGDSKGLAIIDKLLSKSGRLHTFCFPGSYSCYYHDGPTYWIRAVPFEPNQGMKSERSNHYHCITTKTQKDAFTLSAILNSSTFYFFFKAISNCRDFGTKEFNEYRIDNLPSDLSIQLSQLGLALGKRLKETAKRTSRKYPSGFVEYEEYYPAMAKAIIDQIDAVLAKHYGFTDEELDFIINYDIKYRMGKNNDDDE